VTEVDGYEPISGRLARVSSRRHVRASGAVRRPAL